ncbi:hypothetical protein ACRN9L_10375 [Shewanella oncorhynchi]|uniref:hypothetical protein n=1 Tax=Shewanella oncorhynchi TaxID=2726434 RepID=UPI003D792013
MGRIFTSDLSVKEDGFTSSANEIAAISGLVETNFCNSAEKPASSISDASSISAKTVETVETVETVDANAKSAEIVGANVELSETVGANAESAEIVGANVELSETVGANAESAEIVEANAESAETVEANAKSAEIVDANVELSETVDANAEPVNNADEVSIFSSPVISSSAFKNASGKLSPSDAVFFISFAMLIWAKMRFTSASSVDISSSFTLSAEVTCTVSSVLAMVFLDAEIENELAVTDASVDEKSSLLDSWEDVLAELAAELPVLLNRILVICCISAPKHHPAKNKMAR